MTKKGGVDGLAIWGEEVSAERQGGAVCGQVSLEVIAESTK